MNSTTSRAAHWTSRKVYKLLKITVVLILIGIVASAFLARSKRELEPWHRAAPAGEFQSSQLSAGYSFADYHRQEQALFERLKSFYVSEGESRRYSPISRYLASGINNPESFPTNFNRTQELSPEKPVGAVLLLHGLTDSPYSLRNTAEFFFERNFYVLNLRVPGHGTTPSALVSTYWEDWIAAVQVAVPHVVAKAGEGPFYLVGYSNGGALALKHVSESLLKREQRKIPDALFLLSPAVGVTAFSRVANWHRLISWMPYFEQARWLSVLPEIDPYKYNSFPKNAGRQIWELTLSVQADLEALDSQGRLDELPPILTFQSLVDATIRGEDVLTRLYQRLQTHDSELVVFDVRQSSVLSYLLSLTSRGKLEQLFEDTKLPFRFTLLTNKKDDPAVYEWRKPPGAAEPMEIPTELSWPKNVFSLSHVAIPFPADDPIYGDGSGARDDQPVQLGDLALRGENGILSLSANFLMRLRYNPFYSFVEQRMDEWVSRIPPRIESKTPQEIPDQTLAE